MKKRAQPSYTRRTGLDVSCIVGNPQLGVSAALGVPFLAGFATEGKEHRVLPAIKACADQITARTDLTKRFGQNEAPNACLLCHSG